MAVLFCFRFSLFLVFPDADPSCVVRGVEEGARGQAGTWLLEAGRLRVTWQNGKTPLELAKKRGNFQVAALLRQVSARARWGGAGARGRWFWFRAGHAAGAADEGRARMSCEQSVCTLALACGAGLVLTAARARRRGRRRRVPGRRGCRRARGLCRPAPQRGPGKRERSRRFSVKSAGCRSSRPSRWPIASPCRSMASWTLQRCLRSRTRAWRRLWRRFRSGHAA